MRVYILEIGAYSQRGVVGVYATAEHAMAAVAEASWTVVPATERCPASWVSKDGDRAEVTQFELQGVGDLGGMCASGTAR